nr:glycine-rich protein GRP16 [Arabidopsis thaliana]
MLSFLIPVVQFFQVVIAAVASVVFFVFAGITFGASIVGLTIATPLFVIFSPILVPATIATTFLVGGATAAVALGVTAFALILWLFKHRIGVKPKNNPAPKGAPTKADQPGASGGASGDKPGEMSGAGGPSGDKPGGASGGGDKPGGASGGASGGGPGGASGGASGGGPGGASGGGPGGASGGASGDKPEGAPGDKPGGASGGKPGKKPGHKPAGARGGKRLAWW